jgi:hypothetical protein
VVRLEELPEEEAGEAEPERFEIGIAFDSDSIASGDDLLDFLERSRIGGNADPG